ncbi:helix-turn-helix transcriptional regulator [Streptomyces spiralis]|uniref:helix-turn-helix transcriptional regulator n=1 Tax=Streptomyces spiralis TaxID=66376 RepID=UPI001676C86F|nr:LuxR family transcriptional regulator [Streptomyces spiralis]
MGRSNTRGYGALAAALVVGTPLRGRDEALTGIGMALDRAREHHGTAVVLRGGPGSGKSALLRWTADRAVTEGWQVFHLAGTHQGALVPFAALRSLAYPVLNTSPDLPYSLRSAFLDAMAVGVGSSDALLAYSALWQMLFAAARACPTLVIVDDCHWLDPGSARALAFLAHRLQGSRLVILAAAPSHRHGPFDGDDVKEIVLDALDDTSAAALLADHHPGLAPLVRSTVMAAAGGNPLALLDLPAALTSRQRRGEALLPDPLPAGPALDRALGGRFRELPADTRTVLSLMAIAAGEVERKLVNSVAENLGISPNAIAVAERAGLVVGDRVLCFAEPVYRSVADSTAPASLRRKAYAAWAEYGLARYDALGHRGRADTRGEDTAARLEALARAATTRGDWNVAVRAYQRAGDLTTLPAERTRRHVAAGSAALRAGRPGLALALTRESDIADGRSATARTLQLVRACAEYETAFFAEHARRELADALKPGPVVGADVRDETVLRLAELSSLLHRPGPARQALDWLDRFGQGGAPLRIAVTAQLAATSRAAGSRAQLHEAADRLDTAQGPFDARELVWLADTALRIDETALGNHLVSTALRRVERDDRTRLHHCWALQADLMVSAGRWAELRRIAPSRIEAAGRDGLARRGVDIRAQLLMVCSYQGRRDEAEPLLRQVRQWGVDHGSVHHVQLAAHAACVMALAAGDETPADVVGLVALPVADDSLVSTVARRAHVDVVQAALAREDIAGARRQHDRAVELGLDQVSADMAVRVGHGEALISAHAGAPDTEDRFRRAHEAARKSSCPFDRARLALDYGSWLRRQRETSAARTQLRAAHDAFARLGAAPWRERARRELRATGVSVRDQGAEETPTSGVLFLSAQERRIARLAAAGLSNRQIADQLFISPRTVGSHLYKVFPRLGISSRRELRSALRDFDDRT